VRYIQVVATSFRPAPAQAIKHTPYTPALWAQIIISSAMLGLIIGVVGNLFLSFGPTAGKEYHLWRWQADTLLGTAFELVGIGPDASAGDVEALYLYFRLTSEIQGAIAVDDTLAADALTGERTAYKNDVERLLEAWISEAVGDAGLKRSLPLFGGVEFLWPPVELELTSPPALLVRSPRNVIDRAGDTLLKNDLTLADIERIESGTDDDDIVSVVVSIGGLAAYPAIVRDDRSYNGLLDTSAHEWVHHYLTFYPLGLRFGKGTDGTKLNETTADLAGRKIAEIVRERHPLEFAEGEDGRAPPRPAPTADFGEVMRQLRIDVDALLAEGKVGEAEALMEERRLYLLENGHTIRKINQAYFAFHGSYGASAAAGSDPTGDKIDRVFELSGDVGTFLRLMREVESTAELDALLAALEATVP
jgi:hypothetical protein